MADILGLMKQAAELKSKMEAMQAELDQVEVEGSSGGGLVTVKLSGKGEMKAIVSPASYRRAPADMSQSPAVNVAQAYARYAAAMEAGAAPAPDFGHAVVRHSLIDALERSHAEGRVIKLG